MDALELAQALDWTDASNLSHQMSSAVKVAAKILKDYESSGKTDHQIVCQSFGLGAQRSILRYENFSEEQLKEVRTILDDLYLSATEGTYDLLNKDHETNHLISRLKSFTSYANRFPDPFNYGLEFVVKGILKELEPDVEWDISFRKRYDSIQKKNLHEEHSFDNILLVHGEEVCRVPLCITPANFEKRDLIAKLYYVIGRDREIYFNPSEYSVDDLHEELVKFYIADLTHEYDYFEMRSFMVQHIFVKNHYTHEIYLKSFRKSFEKKQHLFDLEMITSDKDQAKKNFKRETKKIFKRLVKRSQIERVYKAPVQDDMLESLWDSYQKHLKYEKDGRIKKTFNPFVRMITLVLWDCWMTPFSFWDEPCRESILQMVSTKCENNLDTWFGGRY